MYLRASLIASAPKPLIVMTPKSLLRHPSATSTFEDLVSGEFQLVIENANSHDIDRVVLCSGKVYYDLLAARTEYKKENVALVRVEQLYPFPVAEVKDVLKKYQNVHDIVWCQEEPQNQGAWFCMHHSFKECLQPGQTLQYAGRSPSASTAVGYVSMHKKQQTALINDALKNTCKGD